MANNLENVTPQILAQALVQLRGATVMPRLVNLDYSTEAAQHGATIDVPIYANIEAKAVSPGNTPPVDDGHAPESVQIPLDQWWEAAFPMTDKDILEAMNGHVPGQVTEAVKSIGNKINQSVFDLYTGVYGYTGTANTTPFGEEGGGLGIKDATNARKVLQQQKAPLHERRMVLDPDAAASALSLRAFQDASWRGDAGGVIEGQIGRKLGFDFFEDQEVPTHVAGTITTGLAVKAAEAHAVGETDVVCTTAAATGECALKVGDIITFSGDDQTYVVTAPATEPTAATDVTVSISPGLKEPLGGGESVTVKGTHVVNLGFQRNAFALAMRPLAAGFRGGSLIESMSDPLTGLTLRLEVSRQHKQTRWSIDALWGVKLVRPEFATRLAG